MFLSSRTTRDPSASSPSALEAEITTLVAHLNAGTFRFLTLIADFDTCQGWGGRGIRSCAHWLNWKCGIGLNAAREQLRVAHALRNLPQVSEAMRQGQLSYTKVRAITRVATAENEQCLLAIAHNGTASHVETVVRHYRRTKRIEELERDTARYAARTLRYFWDDDGCLVIEARLPPEQGALVVQALRAADEALRPHPTPLATAHAHAEHADPQPVAIASAPLLAVAVITAAATPGASSAGTCGGDNSAPCENEQRALATSVLNRRDPDRFVGLDPEQQETLERLEVAAEQQPSPDPEPTESDADIRAGTWPARGPVDASTADPADAHASVSAVTPGMPLGWGQRQADAFCLMAETLLASGPVALKSGDRHMVHVRVDLEALCDEEGVGTSAFEDGPAIPPQTVRRLCCDGGLVTWLRDGAGNTLDVGRKTRVVSTALRRLLERRDGGCRFPGCEQRRFVDAHHIQHWADGGQTNADNLLLLCRYHHRTLHEGGFRVSGDARRPVFIDPDGHVVRAAPSLPGLVHGDGLPEQHAERGLDLHARTAIPGWGGERADYTWMLTILAQHDRRGQQRPPTHSS